MALSKPVIATDGGGTKELIIDNYTGYIILPKSPITLAKKINFLLNDAGKIVSYGKKGEERIENVFGIDKMSKKFAKIYKEICEEK